MGHHPTSNRDPVPPRHPLRLAVSALCVVALAVAGAAAVFQNAAAPHAQAYAKAQRTPPHSTEPPLPQHLRRLAVVQADLGALAQVAATGPAPRVRAASALAQLEVWTREGNLTTGQRITSWRALDGSGHISTLTLPDIPSSTFRTSMIARTSFETAEYNRRIYAPGQMPNHSHWPATLAADPHALLDQLMIIRPGIATAADLMRALAIAHTRYVITRETRAATLTLMATTSGIAVKQANIPAYDLMSLPIPVLLITARDATGNIAFQLMPDTGYLIAATEHSHRGGAGSRHSFSHTVFLSSAEHFPAGW